MANLKYWLWLSALPGVRGATKLALLEQFEHPEAVYFAEEEALALVEMRRTELTALQEKSLDTAEKALADCRRLGLRILTICDAEYPERLKNIYDPPILLYVRGQLPAVDEEAAVAVVGTRRCTPYGIMAAENLSYAMASQGALIVSGLAEGIDAAAHRGALRAGKATVAVIGGGHDLPYPACNRYLYEDIVAGGGAILSEYPPGTEHKGSHFPVRNRIISGLALGVLVVEAPRRSGALITAHAAMEQGRDVFAVPGPIDSPSSAGPLDLLRDGALMAAEAWDVLGHYAEQYPHKLGWKEVECPPPLGAEEPVQQPAEKEPEEEPLREVDLAAETVLTDDQIHILRALNGKLLQVDEVMEITCIPVRRVLSALTMLELDGYVRQESGKRFQLAVRLR